MTINKGQGQSLKRVGVYLSQPVFSHGHLYVALSRATSPTSLKILIETNDAILYNKTKNIVYRHLLQKFCQNEMYLIITAYRYSIHIQTILWLINSLCIFIISIQNRNLLTYLVFNQKSTVTNGQHIRIET